MFKKCFQAVYIKNAQKGFGNFPRTQSNFGASVATFALLAIPWNLASRQNSTFVSEYSLALLAIPRI